MAQTPMWAGDCPRCTTKNTTFNVKSWVPIAGPNQDYETFVQCRQCGDASILAIRMTGIYELDQLAGSYANAGFRSLGFVFVVGGAEACPAHVDADIRLIFDEAAKCLSISCYQAAGSMFRKVLDVATRKMLPAQPDPEDKSHPDYIAWKVRKDLRLRLDWLLQNGKLNAALEPIMDCVREDGNDAAHDNIGVTEAQDLQDFTVVFLETVYTVPGQIRENQSRRAERRGGA